MWEWKKAKQVQEVKLKEEAIDKWMGVFHDEQKQYIAKHTDGRDLACFHRMLQMEWLPEAHG